MKLQFYSIANFKNLPQMQYLSEEEIFEIEVVGTVLPFRTNNYVVEELIDWENYREDPLYNLTFPQKECLSSDHFNRIAGLLKQGAEKEEIKKAVQEIHKDLNPHPAGQVEKNVPVVDGKRVMGLQHKYAETVLFFPSAGQTCHAFCTFCFRWPQFAAGDTEKFGMSETELLIRYVKENPSVTDILITGGDPMIMSGKKICEMLDAIIEADIPNLKNIRIGSKTLAFWPYRYVTDKDSEEILAGFKRVVNAGYHLSFMAHMSHPAELSTEIVKKAVENIQNTGAVIRAQSPLLNNINAEPSVWKELWETQVNMGIIPYYMFIARPTGGHRYFSVPLVKALKIYREAYGSVSGLARTVRGPSMSTAWGKITLHGKMDIDNEEAMMLEFVQARDISWLKRPFAAEMNENALWINDLASVGNEDSFFFLNDE